MICILYWPKTDGRYVFPPFMWQVQGPLKGAADSWCSRGLIRKRESSGRTADDCTSAAGWILWCPSQMDWMSWTFCGWCKHISSMYRDFDPTRRIFSFFTVVDFASLKRYTVHCSQRPWHDTNSSSMYSLSYDPHVKPSHLCTASVTSLVTLKVQL